MSFTADVEMYRAARSIRCFTLMLQPYLVRKDKNPIGTGPAVVSLIEIGFLQTAKALIFDHLERKSGSIAFQSKRSQMRSIATSSFISPLVHGFVSSDRSKDRNAGMLKSCSTRNIRHA